MELGTVFLLYLAFAVGMAVISFVQLYLPVLKVLERTENEDTLPLSTKVVLSATVLLGFMLAAPVMVLVLLSTDAQISFQESLYAGVMAQTY